MKLKDVDSKETEFHNFRCASVDPDDRTGLPF